MNIFPLSLALLTEEGQRPQYAQVWMYDSDAPLNTQQENVRDLDREVLQFLNCLLMRHNPYTTLFKTAKSSYPHGGRSQGREGSTGRKLRVPG